MDEDKLADFVSKLVLDSYVHPYKNLLGTLNDKQINQLVNARAKKNEFTILSGIVYWKNDDLSNMKLVSLTTGVKCVSDIKLQNTYGKVVHDMHAEILSIRNFSLYILNEIGKLKDGNDSEILERTGFIEKFKIKENIKIAMYISELPCGDCSLDEMIHLDPTPWINDGKSDNLGVYRGRSSYTSVGVVRTKPGRKDSPISLSKSCSDKLTLVELKGLLKGIVSDLIVNSDIGLDYIIVPQSKIDKNIKGIKRCFQSRIDSTKIEPIKMFKILGCNDGIISKYDLELHRQNLSLLEVDREKKKRASELCIVCSPCTGTIEVLNGGIKNGFNFKKAILTNNGISMLCRYSMFQKRKEITGYFPEYNSYLEWKKRSNNKDYSDRKFLAKSSLGEWGYSTIDNFEF